MLSLRQQHVASRGCSWAPPRTHTAKGVMNNIVQARLMKPSVVHLREARTLQSPTSLTIPKSAVAQLFHQQQRSPLRGLLSGVSRRGPARLGSSTAVQVKTVDDSSRSSSSKANHSSSNHASSVPGQAPNTVQVVLTYEVDGVMVPDRSSLVDLRFFPNRRSVRISNHRAFDLLEGKVLAGWRRDEQGRLVAMLKTRDGSSSSLAGTSTSGSSASASSDAASPAAAAAAAAAAPGAAGVVTPQAGAPAAPLGAAGAAAAAASGLGAPAAAAHTEADTASGKGAAKPAGGPAGFISHVQHSVQQQLASSAAMLTAAVKHTLHMAVEDEERQRTYVPARVRPVMNEVYVPFGMWRDLFDGSSRPFPTEGIPLRVMITGAVHMSAQPALLVRRITPYGYYVLRGVKGLSRLKGKLMVRWSLLLNGVVEMEVSDRLPAAAILHPMSSQAAVATEAANN